MKKDQPQMMVSVIVRAYMREKFIRQALDSVLAHEGPVICDVLTEEWQQIIPRVASDKLPDGTLVMRKYEDMYPFLPEDEFKENMIAEK